VETGVKAFELWDTETANLVGDYATEAAALEAVRRMIATGSADRVRSLALAHENRRGATRTIAVGNELLQRARHDAPDANAPVMHDVPAQ
jgi:hypothetical protein